MNTARKRLIVRADFVLGNRPGGGRLACKRWRRVLADALPRLLGCARRCPRAEVSLHEGEGEAYYSGWLRIPIERRPSRRRLRQMKAKLRARLEAGLLPVDGRVLKLGVRRCQARPAPGARQLELWRGSSAARLLDGAEQPVEVGPVGGVAAGVGEGDAPVGREHEVAP